MGSASRASRIPFSRSFHMGQGFDSGNIIHGSYMHPGPEDHAHKGISDGGS